MRHVRLLIEYDGTEYHGWQSQRSGGTIQDILTEKIFDITGESVRLTGASRTDAGVHSLGQVAVFGTESDLPAAVILRALNAKLPKDIRVLHSEETAGTFHPRYQARGKSYFYVISASSLTSVFLYRYLWDIRTQLDLQSMRESASALLGEHDFSAFRGSGCGAKHPVRTVYSLDISQSEEISFMTATLKGEFVKIRVEANAFLRHMVRNIVGTLVEIGRGRMTRKDLKKALDSRDRTLAGPTAPAKGLFLEKVIY